MVVLSAGFLGVALFGGRPAHQPATAHIPGPIDSGSSSETLPSEPLPGTPAATPDSPMAPVPVTPIGAVETAQEPVVRRQVAATRIAADDRRVPIPTRVRSALLLTFGTVGMAVLLGAVLSIVVVGAVLFLV